MPPDPAPSPGEEANPAQIRVLRSGETSLLREFTYLAIFVPPGSEPPPRSILELPEVAKYYANFNPAAELALVAEQAGEVAGAIWARQFPASAKGYGFYRADYPELSIAVLPAWRGKGLGSQLLDALIARGRAQGTRGLSLSVSRGNPARRLYERHGFAVLSVREEDILMVLAL